MDIKIIYLVKPHLVTSAVHITELKPGGGWTKVASGKYDEHEYLTVFSSHAAPECEVQGPDVAQAPASCTPH